MNVEPTKQCVTHRQEGKQLNNSDAKTNGFSHGSVIHQLIGLSAVSHQLTSQKLQGRLF